LEGGAALVFDGHGQSLRLEGGREDVDLGSPVALRFIGSMSISAWIRPSEFPDDDAAIVSSLDRLGFQLDTTVDQGPRTIGFKLTDSAGRLMARYGRTPVVLDEWQYVAGVYDAQARTLHVYLNGHPDDGCSLGIVGDRQSASGEHVKIGRRAGRSGYDFSGLIDDVRIYSRALTRDEVLRDMGRRDAVSSPYDPVDESAKAPAAQSLSCRSFEDIVDRTSLGSAALFAVLMALIVASVAPTMPAWLPAISGFAAGAVPLLLSPFPHPWIVLVLSLSGGLSVAAGISAPSWPIR
jgi:hypothetical protein